MNLDAPPDVLKALYKELVNRRRYIERAAAYYDGAHNLAFASEQFLDAFGGLFRAFADNWCSLVVDAVEERLQVNGFRVGEEPEADDDANRIWQENELDAQSQVGHTDGLAQGAFYATVWVSEDDNTKPEITVESPMSTIVACHPKIRGRRTAGLRTYVDDDGYEHAELFLLKPTARVYLFRSRSKRRSGESASLNPQWVGEDRTDNAGDLDASFSMENPLGKIPIVEFLNRPRLYVSRKAGWAAHSEIASVMPLQDAANKLLADLLVASEFAAFPQRWVTGWEPDTDEATDEVIPPRFRHGPGKVWWTENEDAKFGSFEPATVGGYVTAIEMVVQHIASISSTPPHYLHASADRLSGESLKSAESGLVAKVRRKMRHFGASWEEVMRLAGAVANVGALKGATQMETIWADPEIRTESEHVDAVTKKVAIEVPFPQLWEELGYTPAQVARFPAMRATMELEGMAAAAAARATPELGAPPPAPGAQPAIAEPVAPSGGPVPAEV